MKEELKIHIRLPENYHESFRKIGDNTSQNAIQAITGYIELKRHTINELKGVFTPNEMKYLVDISNATMFMPEYAASLSMLLARVEDANELEGMAEKWNVDFIVFKQKVERLTAAQVYFLQLECYNYWYGSDDAPGDLDKFVQTFQK